MESQLNKAIHIWVWMKHANWMLIEPIFPSNLWIKSDPAKSGSYKRRLRPLAQWLSSSTHLWNRFNFTRQVFTMISHAVKPMVIIMGWPSVTEPRRNWGITLWKTRSGNHGVRMVIFEWLDFEETTVASHQMPFIQLFNPNYILF